MQRTNRPSRIPMAGIRFQGYVLSLKVLEMAIKISHTSVVLSKLQKNPTLRKKSGHTLPRAPLTDLRGPGRQRVANVIALLNISHSTFYARIKSDVCPKPDGYDGRIPFWNNQTVLKMLTEEVCKGA